MARKITWSDIALADVASIGEFISKRSVWHATAVVTKILEETKRLAAFPQSGRLVPEDKLRTAREIFIFDYRIMYDVTDEDVLILRVIHGKRDFTLQ